MKAFIVFALILILAVLGHDAWVAYDGDMWNDAWMDDKTLPFALSEFGWVVTHYIPSAEGFIMDTLEENGVAEYSGHIGWLFRLESINVLLGFLGVFFALGLFFKLSDKMGDFKMPTLGKSSMPKSKSLLKRDSGSSLKYKRK